jgi:predicted nucleotidyltransferase
LVDPLTAIVTPCRRLAAAIKADDAARVAVLAPFATFWPVADHPRSGAELLAVLPAHEAELRARGVETITLFGSLARGDAAEMSDVDPAIRPSVGFSSGGFDHVGRLEALRERLAELLGCDVDLVEEPVVRPRLGEVIAREGLRAF